MTSLLFFFFFSGGESAFSPAASVFGAPQAAAPTSTFGASAPFRCVPSSPPLCFPTFSHPCLFVFVFLLAVQQPVRSEHRSHEHVRQRRSVWRHWQQPGLERHLRDHTFRRAAGGTHELRGRRIRGSALCCRCLPVPHLRRRSLGVLWRRARPGRWRRLLSWRRARRCPRRPSRLARSSPRQGRRTLNLSAPHPPKPLR